LETPLLLSAAVLEVVVLAHNMQQLLQRQVSLQQVLLQQQPELAAARHAGSDTSGSGGVTREVGVNINIAFASLPSSRSLDALQLLVLVKQEDIAGGSSSRPPLLVAAVPILLMPAAAQQEVQQLLLPAMRQDAQAASAAYQQQLDQQQQQLSSEELARQIMQTEHVVWKHFSQMAQDIFIMLQVARQAELVAAAAAETAAAAAETAAAAAAETAAAAAETAAAAAEAAALPAMVQSEAVAAVCPLPFQAPTSQYSTSTAVLDYAASGELAAAATPLLVLDHLAQAVMFPLLLPFLAAHGLHNTLTLLLDQLPYQLQHVWHQQQATRLEALLAVNETPQQLQPLPDLQQQSDTTAAPTTGPCTSSSSGGSSSHSCAASSGPGSAGRSVHESRQQQWAQQLMEPVTCRAGDWRAGGGLTAGPAAVGAEVLWYQPFAGFADDVEQR
jgi:hypothetical protein